MISLYEIPLKLYEIPLKTIRGETTSLAAYKDKVVLVVNVASRCGYTPQYEGLEALYKKYGEKGFVVLGFPCNQFGAQEPEPEEKIAQFCSTTYDVTFPMFAKVDVNGPQQHPLFAKLKSESPGILGTEGIKWNFTKFLIDRKGSVVNRFAPATSPKDLEKEIETLI